MLWQGLLTLPRHPTEGLPTPQQRGDLRSSAVARSPDRATTRMRVMNCPECQDWLQRQLDGEEFAPGDDLREHLAGCAECQARHAAARRLQRALGLMTPPAPPSGLTFRIVREVLADRRRRQKRRRRLAGLLALAACLLVFVLVDAFRP